MDTAVSDNESQKSNHNYMEVYRDELEVFFTEPMLNVLKMHLYPKETRTDLYRAKISQASGNHREALQHLISHLS